MEQIDEKVQDLKTGNLTVSQQAKGIANKVLLTTALNTV